LKSKKLLVVIMVLAALGLVAGVLLAGCGSGTTTTTAAPATTATTAAATTDTTAGGTATTVAGSTDTTVAFNGTFDGPDVTIGALGSLTGTSAMNGAEQIWAQKKAADDINAAGGILLNGKHSKLVLKYVDDQSDPTAGAAAVEKLIKVEGLKIILSTQVTPINLAAAIVAEKYQALYDQVITWTSVARSNNWKFSPDVFFSPDAVADVPFTIVDNIPAGPDKPTKWGVLTEDNADGQALGGGVKAVAAKHNANIVSYQTYTPGTKDYSSVILKFKQANVDAIVTLISASDGITFVQQMKTEQFSPKFMMGWKGFWPTEFQQGLGAASDYILHDGFWSESEGFPGDTELGAAYSASHNGNSSVSIGLPYAQVQILAAAITNAQSTDPAKVRDQIYGHTFKGTTMGDVTYDAQGVADISPLALQWMGGKRVLIYPNHFADLKTFVAWEKR
jgi:branched-chain amino acid transport system substrate-binding protein